MMEIEVRNINPLTKSWKRTYHKIKKYSHYWVWIVVWPIKVGTFMYIINKQFLQPLLATLNRRVKNSKSQMPR